MTLSLKTRLQNLFKRRAKAAPLPLARAHRGTLAVGAPVHWPEAAAAVVKLLEQEAAERIKSGTLEDTPHHRKAWVNQRLFELGYLDNRPGAAP